MLTLETLHGLKDFFCGRRALDIGCGSGILSLYLASTGAGKVCGTDIDPFVIEEAVRNARKNKFKKNRVRFGIKDINSFKKRFPIIVANVPVNIHAVISEKICSLLDSHGVLVSGGAMVSQTEEIKRIYKDLTVVKMFKKNDWAVLIFSNKLNKHFTFLRQCNKNLL